LFSLSQSVGRRAESLYLLWPGKKIAVFNKFTCNNSPKKLKIQNSQVVKTAKNELKKIYIEFNGNEAENQQHFVAFL
jgi:hypothetical protein